MSTNTQNTQERVYLINRWAVYSGRYSEVRAKITRQEGSPYRLKLETRDPGKDRWVERGGFDCQYRAFAAVIRWYPKEEDSLTLVSV